MRPGTCKLARACLALLVAVLAGCGGHAEFTIEAAAPRGEAPVLPAAVLRVTAVEPATVKTGGWLWGSVPCQAPERQFAELLGHYAVRDGGFEMVDDDTLHDRLSAVDMPTGLQPTDEAARLAALAGGCGSYLTAHVESWWTRYQLARSYGCIRYTLACRSPADGHALWEVSVCRRESGRSDREVAAAALRDTFRWLREHFPTPGPCECQE